MSGGPSPGERRAALGRALRLGAALVAVLVLALAATRWQASGALEAARARTAALGLRVDPALLGAARSAAAEAALAEAGLVMDALGEAQLRRYDTEVRAGESEEERWDRMDAEEAGRAAEELVAVAERFVAAGVADTPEADLLADFARTRDGDAGGTPAPARMRSGAIRHQLVEALCDAARHAAAAGDAREAWRRTALAARVAATGRGGGVLGVGYLAAELAELRRAAEAATAVGPAAEVPEDPWRADLRDAVRGLDVLDDARRALRREGAFLLYAVDGGLELGVTHGLRLRLMSGDLRDRALLHDTWAEIVTLTSGPSDPTADLVALEERIAALPMSYPLVKLTAPRASSFWQHATSAEANRAALLTD